MANFSISIMHIVCKKDKGFTLIELLVVVAIIGILAAVGVVAYNGYTASARKAVAQTNFDMVVKTLTFEYNFCLMGTETHILNRADGNKPAIECDKALTNLEDGVRAFHPIFNSMNIRNPHNNPVSGKVGEFDVNVGAYTESMIRSNHNQFKNSTWPGLIHITSISPNQSQKSIAVYTKTGPNEPLIHKVIILE
jgi:prepilin-type N-terminal cleavage/methylation domain-containing protein